MAAAKQWFSGTVKEAQSGDCVVIAGAPLATGTAPEKRLNLAHLSAPRMPRRDGTTTSDEFAWESRQFLMQLAVGQLCTFRTDYKVDAIDREFGTVVLQKADGTRVDVGMQVASAGWAKVRDGNDTKTPAYEKLKEAAEAAEEAGLGVYETDPDARALSRFEYDLYAASDGADYVHSKGVGCPVPGYVDAVLTGSTVKVVTVPDKEVLTFVLCGAQSPSVRRNPEGGFTADPYGMDARALTESLVLNREVRCVVQQGEDGRIFGTLMYEGTAPKASAPSALSLADTLLDAGLAKYVEWSASFLEPAQAARLKQRELGAKDRRDAMWTDYEPPVKATAKLGDSFRGKVLEVVSGDTVVVKDPSGKECRFSLASIRTPRLRPSDNPTEPEPYARDARNFLRKHFIGKDVTVRLEFSRKVLPGANAPVGGGAELTMSLGNMALEGGKAGPQEAAEMIVRRGFGSVTNAREGEERSSLMGQLMDAEEYARTKRIGIHSGKDSGSLRVNDCTVPGSAARAKQYLPFFQRTTLVPGIVEHVMSGSRIKVHVPKESVQIAFSPSGVKTPSRGAPARGNLPAIAPEPFGDEAYRFVREAVMQRDVTLTVESMDKAGNFLGRLYCGKVDLSLALLTEGLGSLHPSFSPDRVSGAEALISAQEGAQAARKGIWKDWEPEAEEAAAVESTGPANGVGTPTRNVTVTHVTNASCIHLQTVDEPRVAWVTKEAASSAAASTGGLKTPPRPGLKVLAKFSQDGNWYRGFVEKVYEQATKNEACEIYFMDYGNRERVPLSSLKPLDAALAAPAPLAHTACLAYLKLPGPSDEDYGWAAADAVADACLGGRTFTCKTVTTQRVPGSHPRDAAGLAHVVLFPEGSSDLEQSVNAGILESGYAKLPPITAFRTPQGQEAAAVLCDFEDVARRAHRGIFRYGDPGDSDSDDGGPSARRR